MNIETYVQALQYAKAYAELRELYNELSIIADEKHVDNRIKYEANELTKDGFDMFVNKTIIHNKELEE